MRHTALVLVLLLTGCLAVQEPHNPAKRKKKKSDTAPVASAARAEEKKEDEEPAPDLGPVLSKVELMKQMFLMQKDLKAQLLQMSSELSQEELAELNEWLKQYGVQIQRKKCENPDHDHGAGRNSEVY